jgi:hypothetical protein
MATKPKEKPVQDEPVFNEKGDLMTQTRRKAKAGNIFEEDGDDTAQVSTNLEEPSDETSLATFTELPSDLVVPEPPIHFEDEQPAILWASLAQTTSETGSPGFFVVRDLDQEFSELTFVPIHAHKSRTLWPSGAIVAGRLPECGSQDGVEPSPRFYLEDTQPPSDTCADCQFN